MCNSQTVLIHSVYVNVNFFTILLLIGYGSYVKCIWNMICIATNNFELLFCILKITGVSIVYSIVCSGADQRKHQSSTVTGELSVQRASNAQNISIWWRHHVLGFYLTHPLESLNIKK